MRIVGFLAAVLVIFSFLMPWFQTEVWYGAEQVTMLDIVKELYSSASQIEEIVDDLNQNFTSASMLFLSYVIGVFMVFLGALFGLTGGRAGHLLGITGMILLTYPIWTTTGREIFNVISYGYVVGGIGFLIGLVGGGTGKK